ncbi:MAG: MBL fold metallo-hydrolase [Novosphingobium sp.]|uniref:MBL fold metallo-hydrolase n=1 Tax=Novosphingobium sp. TaxID=1874826 RepID=UPI003B9AFB6A
MPSPAQSPAPSTQWITFGTSGGPAVQVQRSQIANALLVNGAIYLFDLGNGVQRQMALAGLPENAIKAVFLSHHHLDHNADLGPIIMTRWTFFPSPLPIFGPQGTAALATGLARSNAPTELAGFPTFGPAKPTAESLIRAVDLPSGLSAQKLVFEDENVRIWAIGVDHFQVPPSVALPHLPDAVAYRVEAGGRTFVFTGDSGPSSRLTELARGADVLVTEVVEPEGIAASLAQMMKGAPAAARDSIVNGMTRNHLTPRIIGEMAQKAGVKHVVLTHFVPSPESVADQSIYRREIAVNYDGPVSLANDLDRF